MRLQRIIGRAGTGKTSTCLEQIRQKLQVNPEGPPIIYLVPEQMTFQSEYTLATTPGLNGMIRAQVFSFTRLAWRVLQETGGLSRQHLDSTGIHMLLRKMVERHKQEFRLYGRAAEQTGFIDYMEKILIECKRYCVEAKDLQALYEKLEAEKDDGDRTIVDKLRDLYVIINEMEAELNPKYVASEDYLRLLAEKIPSSKYIQESEIWIDGFYSFTPQELLIVEALLKHAKKVTITHLIDKEYDQDLPHELHLFHSTAKTYQRVYRIAQSLGVHVEPTRTLATCAESIANGSQRPKSPSLVHLESNYQKRPLQPYKGETTILLASAVNRRAEVEGLAREILTNVREQDYQYKEIAILIRNIDDYQELLETVFAEYKIPVFLDQKKPMLHHPLIELVRSCLDVVNQNWNYEAVFRCVKTDLMVSASDINVEQIQGYEQIAATLFEGNEQDVADETVKQWKREALDRLENYVLAQGIYGNRWKEAGEWKFTSKGSIETGFEASADDMERQTEINYWRRKIATPLIELEKRFKKCKDGRQFTEALYNFLVELNVPEAIAKWQLEAEEQGQLEIARQHQQAWQAVINLFEQLVEIVETEEISSELFSKMVESGLESMKFSQVPPAFDQVLVATIDHSRLMGIRCSYFIGVNEGVIPAKKKEDGILTEEERALINGAGLELAPSFTSILLEEPFVVYNALTSATDRLWVSYPLADEEGKSLLPSSLCSQLKQMFPDAPRPFLVIDPQEETEEQQLQYVTNPDVTISYLTSQLRYWKRGYPLAEVWWDVYNWYADNKTTFVTNQWRKSLDSLFYKNQEFNLKARTSEGLYGKHIKTSVSRMEKHRGCPFSQFAAYGLQLKEREMYRLENPDIGQLYHGALKLIADRLRETGKHWGDVTELEYAQLAQEIVNNVAPRVQNKVLLSSNRYQYIVKRLIEVITRTTIVLGKQARVSGFTPVGIEVGFDTGEKLPALQLQLANGKTISLRGRIDRVDQAVINDELFLRVIDYKSSGMGVDLSEIADGISLQMLTYLDVIITFAEQWLGQQASPAGVLYFHVQNPLIQAKEAYTVDKLEEERFKKYKLKGLLLAEQTIAEVMDTALAGDGSRKSDIIPATIKVNGDFGSRSSVVTRQQFTILREHVREVICKMGSEIMEGTISIAPYRLKQKTPCTFCSYRPVCQFDIGQPENEYRKVPLIKGVDALFSRIGGDSNEAGNVNKASESFNDSKFSDTNGR